MIGDSVAIFLLALIVLALIIDLFFTKRHFK